MAPSESPPPPPSALDAFVTWFRAQEGAFLSPQVELADLGDLGRGRGLLASSDIPAGAVVLVIPRRSVLSVDTSGLVHKLPLVFGRGAPSAAAATGSVSGNDSDEELELQSSDAGLDLILALLYEYLHGGSPWKPYLDILPDHFDTLLYWDPLELRELQASAVTGKIGRDDADRVFRSRLLPVIRKHAHLFFPITDRSPTGAAAAALAAGDPSSWSDDELLRLAHRMGSIVTAYAFDLETSDPHDDEPSMAGNEEDDGWIEDLDGRMALGLVPMADMLNADAEFNVHLNHEQDALTMTALRPIRAGEELLNYYGPLPNSELLLRYGYTSPKHGLYDVVEMPWELIRGAIRGALGPGVGLPPDDDMDESYVLERASDGPDETGVINSSATFTEFPEDLEAQVAPILAPALGIDLAAAIAADDDIHLPPADQARLGRAFVTVMARALQARLDQYGTSIAADQELLRSVRPGTRYAKALAVRLGEKNLLQEALDFAAHALLDRKGDGSDADDDDDNDDRDLDMIGSSDLTMAGTDAALDADAHASKKRRTAP